MSSLDKGSSPGAPSSSALRAPPSSAPRAAKKTKTDLLAVLAMDFVDLALLSHNKLVESVVLLQTAYQTSQKELAAAKKAGTKAGGGVLQPIQASSGPESWTEEQVAAKAVQVREVAFEAIKSPMKQPSCKTNSTKWSYTGVVPSHAVFYKVFDLPVPRTKRGMFKMKRLHLSSFSATVGCPEASIRYGTLEITGETVTLKWAADDNSFTLSGTYGKGI